MLSTAQQMLQDSRTKIELLRMQIIKVTQAREGEREAADPEGEGGGVGGNLSPVTFSMQLTVLSLSLFLFSLFFPPLILSPSLALPHSLTLTF